MRVSIQKHSCLVRKNKLHAESHSLIHREHLYKNRNGFSSYRSQRMVGIVTRSTFQRIEKHSMPNMKVYQNPLERRCPDLVCCYHCRYMRGENNTKSGPILRFLLMRRIYVWYLFCVKKSEDAKKILQTSLTNANSFLSIENGLQPNCSDKAKEIWFGYNQGTTLNLHIGTTYPFTSLV